MFWQACTTRSTQHGRCAGRPNLYRCPMHRGCCATRRSQDDACATSPPPGGWGRPHSPWWGCRPAPHAGKTAARPRYPGRELWPRRALVCVGRCGGGSRSACLAAQHRRWAPVVERAESRRPHTEQGRHPSADNHAGSGKPGRAPTCGCRGGLVTRPRFAIPRGGAGRGRRNSGLGTLGPWALAAGWALPTVCRWWGRRGRGPAAACCIRFPRLVGGLAAGRRVACC